MRRIGKEVEDRGVSHTACAVPIGSVRGEVMTSSLVCSDFDLKCIITNNIPQSKLSCLFEWQSRTQFTINYFILDYAILVCG